MDKKEIEKELIGMKVLVMEVGRRMEKLISSGIEEIKENVEKEIKRGQVSEKARDFWKQYMNSLPLFSNMINVELPAKSPITSEVFTNNGKGKFSVTNPSVEWVRAKILEAGSKIGSVWFYKREDDSLRKMCFKLSVVNPSVSPSPKLTSGHKVWAKKEVDKKNNQITVYDCNKTVRNKLTNEVIGRGQYRTIPLDRVIRIVSNGNVYEIKRDDLPLVKSSVKSVTSNTPKTPNAILKPTVNSNSKLPAVCRNCNSVTCKDSPKFTGLIG